MIIPIKNVITRNVIYVRPETPIYEALALLPKHKISGMPVVNENMSVVGILSEKDVLKILIDQKLNVKKVVGDYMSTSVITFTEDANAIDICKFFINSHVRRVPIVNDSKLVGIISRRDIVNLILQARSEISEFRYV